MIIYLRMMAIMNPNLANILTLSTIGIAIAGVVSLLSDVFLGHRSRVDKRLDEEFRQKLTEKARTSTQLFRDLGALASENGLKKRGLKDALDFAFEQAGMLPDRRLFPVATLGFGLVTGAVSLCVTGHAALTLAGAAIGLSVPLLMLHLKGQRRREKMCHQLPEACEMISGAVRAGQTLPRAFQLAAQESPAPLGEEFAYCNDQQAMGMPPSGRPTWG